MPCALVGAPLVNFGRPPSIAIVSKTDGPAQLVGRISRADWKAFADLYKETSPKIFSICLSILNDRIDAEEALQEVYAKVWQGAGAFVASRGTPSSFLAAIARNKAIDKMRARKPVAGELNSGYDLPDPGPDPEKQAVMSDEGRRIDTCMEELEADRAQAVKRPTSKD